MIADGMVANVAAWSAELRRLLLTLNFTSEWFERVAWMMTMLVVKKTRQADVEIRACLAGDEGVFGQS